MSKTNFAGVKMPSVALGGGRNLRVEQCWGDKDQLFFRTEIDAFLNVKQVAELTRRLTEWLDTRTAPAEPKLWEDV